MPALSAQTWTPCKGVGNRYRYGPVRKRIFDLFFTTKRWAVEPGWDWLRHTVLSRTMARSLGKGTERILLVDDAAMVTGAGQAMLEELGCHWFVAQSGEQALDIVRHDGRAIDLIMLGLDGGKPSTSSATSSHPYR